ncbi:MAG: membrane protein insertase YidC [Candidatus Latescibacteria bacterium]|nr:membrane protein insertase YidC [Candidatus Latescibacterota bacterium]
MSKSFGMERRALIAFVASMALFLLYDALYLAPKMREERARREATQLEQTQEMARLKRVAPGDTLSAGEEPPALVPAPAGDSLSTAFAPPDTAAADAPSKRIVVVSPLFEITLDTRGAVIESVHLLRFAGADGPVELLPPGDSWSGDRMLSATIRGSARELAVEKIVFEATARSKTVADGARVDIAAHDSVDVVFRAAGAGGTIERAYRFYGDRYDFRTLLRASETLVPGAETVEWSFGPGLTSTEENVRDDQSKFRASVLLGQEFHRKHPGDFARANVEEFSGTLNWASLQTKYFLAAFIPPQPLRAEIEMSGIKSEHRVSQKVAIPAAVARGEITSELLGFFGPLDFELVGGLGVGLEKNVEFGWKFIRPVSVAVLWSMNALHKVIPNYGWVIIIISILTKVLFYRLTHKSFKSMKEMQDLQPRIAALKEKFGSDRRRLSEETMKLYKEAGVNPLGGCLPMLLQMPVFIALFNVLSHAIELRGAPWIAWIDDLSQQDVLFRLPASLPLVGDAFSLLPLLMGASMWAQSKLGGSPTGQPGNPMPPGFNTILPIVFTFLFYKMPSGLVIYWIINTVLSVAQQYYIVKSHNTPALAVVPEPAAPARKKRRARKSS